jgi:hypothetical protein
MSIWRRSALLGILMGLEAITYAGEKPLTREPQPQTVRESHVSPFRETGEEKDREQSISRIKEILRGIANSSREWHDHLAATRVQAEVADLTWDADASGARNYLLLAWQTAKQIKEEQPISRYRNDSQGKAAKGEVLRVARKRAPELAKQWIDELSQEAETDNHAKPHGVFDDRTTRSQVLMEMAFASVTENPHAAAELATDSLSDGISFGLQYVLLGLQEKDFALAKEVFRAALQRLRTYGLIDPDELVVLHSYLFTPGRVFASNTTADRNTIQMSVSRNPVRVAAAGELDPALALEFLNLGADLLVNAPLPSSATDLQLFARQAVSAIGVLSPKMVQLLPARAAQLATRDRELQAAANYSSAPNNAGSDIPFVAPRKGETKEDLSDRQVDAWEAKAQKETDGLARDIDYAQAAIATLPQAYVRGWSLAGRINDLPLKQGVTDYISCRASFYFASVGQFEKAHELSVANSDAAQRAVALIITAQRLVKATNTQLATQYLQEARTILSGAEPNEEWVRIALGVVSTFGQFNNDTALLALSDAVRMINKSPISPSGDERAPLLLRFSGFTIPNFTYGTTGFGLRAVASVFDLEHFWRSLDIVNMIETPEIRGVTAVALCRRQLESLSNMKEGKKPTDKKSN